MQRSELAVLIDAATNAASLARTLSTDQGAILATQLGAVVASIVAEQDQRNDVL